MDHILQWEKTYLNEEINWIEARLTLLRMGPTMNPEATNELIRDYELELSELYKTKANLPLGEHMTVPPERTHEDVLDPEGLP